MYKISLRQSSKIKKILPVIALHLAIGVLICVLISTGFPCPFKYIFGIPCPACGSLHALHAIIHGDFYGYIQHNYLAIPMIMAFWFGIHKKALFGNKIFINIFIYTVCFLVVIRYFLLIFYEYVVLLEA